MGFGWSWNHVRETDRTCWYVGSKFCHMIATKTLFLIAQLQKHEDSASESLEFERLKEHFEPFIRSSLSASTSTSHPTTHISSATHSHHHSNPITAAASAALARDIPGVGKYNPLARSTSGRGGSTKDRSVNKDEMLEYRSRLNISKASAHGTGGGDVDVELLRRLDDIGHSATLEQRWLNSWASPLRTRYVFYVLFRRFEGLNSVQGFKTFTNTSSLETIKTVSSLYAHPDQARTKGTVCQI